MAWALKGRFRGLGDELAELERTDPLVRASAESYWRMVEKVTGRELCAVCGGLGFFEDEQGIADCSCGGGR